MIWKLSRLSKESEKDFFKNFKMMMMMMTIDKERKWQTTCNLSGRENDDNDDCPLAIKKRKCLRLSLCSKWQNLKLKKQNKKEMKNVTICQTTQESFSFNDDIQLILKR